MGNDEEFKINVNIGGNSNNSNTPQVGSEIKPQTQPQTQNINVNPNPVQDYSALTTDPISSSSHLPSQQLNDTNNFASNSNNESTSPLTSPEPVNQSSSFAEKYIQPNAVSQDKSPDPNSFFQPSIPVEPAPEEKGTFDGNLQHTISTSGSGTPPKKSINKKNKVLFASLIGVALLFGGSASAYFGYVVPSKPENVWSKALSNTLKGYDKLTKYQESNKDKTTYKIDGDYKISAGDYKTDGNYSFHTDQKDSKANFDLGIAGSRLKIDSMATIPDNNSYPDVYIKAEGLKTLENVDNGKYKEYINKAENNWLFIDHTFFDQLVFSSTGTNSPEENNLTQEDVKNVMEVVGNTTRKYVITDDASLTILNASEYKGKEEIDSRQQYHYKVGLNKENFKKYLEELVKNLESTDAFKKYAGEDFEPSNPDDMKKWVDDEIDENYKADVWVDASTKLIRTVRFTNKNNDKTYFDVGLKYDGGKKFPFYAKYVLDEADGKGTIDLNVILNTEDDSVDMNFTGNFSGDSFDTIEFSINGKVTFSNEDITIEKPSETISLTEVIRLEELSEEYYPTDFGANGSGDAERKNELKNLQQKLESYFDDNDNYPEDLSIINISSEEMTGPSGDLYTYNVTNSGMEYTISAILENKSDPDSINGVYIIKSINVLGASTINNPFISKISEFFSSLKTIL